MIVGSLPTRNGASATMRAGCLIVLDSSGRAVETIAGGAINGPWDMTAVDHGDRATLFVTNVLNGTVSASPRTVHRGTVVRIGLAIPVTGAPHVTSQAVIARGLPERTDPASLVVGPTGVALHRGTLYVADSARNAITTVSHAATRHTATTGATLTMGGELDDPLGLAIAGNGDVLTTNGGDGNLVETTQRGRQVARRTLDDTKVPGAPNGSGTLFGLAVQRHSVLFVDDGNNTLRLLR